MLPFSPAARSARTASRAAGRVATFPSGDTVIVWADVVSALRSGMGAQAKASSSMADILILRLITCMLFFLLGSNLCPNGLRVSERSGLGLGFSEAGSQVGGLAWADRGLLSGG